MFLGELATFVQEGKDNIAVSVLDNSARGWIKWEQTAWDVDDSPQLSATFTGW